jgi:pimeloyl-ACP methyl ester carboxylesterase
MRVFVHGVPETAVVWDGLTGRSGRLFRGAHAARLRYLPAGFTPAKDQYASWLMDELKKIKGPIDLIGHDWGADRPEWALQCRG